MPSRKRKNTKLKKAAIEWLKWISAIVPICGFFYILYYYKQLDFFKKDRDIKSVTTVIDQKDSVNLAKANLKSKVQEEIKISQNEWHSVGGVAIHNLLIENKADQHAKNIEVEFKYLSDMQEALTTKVITITKDLPPGKSTRITDVSVGFVNKGAVGCDTKVIGATF
jgi:hypothetical protein